MIRVGLVGFGLAGRVFHAPLISSVEGLELAGVVERKSDHAAQRYPGITTYRSVEELLADPSIKLVVIATPNGTHYPLAMQALQAAKSVVVDKPVALSSTQISELAELAGGIGLHLFPFHNRRFDNDFLTVRKVIDEHLLGRIVHFESTFDRWRPSLSTRAWKEEADEGGILLDIGTHLVDQALLLFGSPATVGAEVRRERDGEGSNDSISLRLGYFTGVSVTIGSNPLARASICGARGAISGSGDSILRKMLSEKSRRLPRITGARSLKIAGAPWASRSMAQSHCAPYPQSPEIIADSTRAFAMCCSAFPLPRPQHQTRRGA